MFKLVPMKTEHVRELLAEPMNENLRYFFGERQIQDMCSGVYNFSALQGSDVVGCGGILEYWEGRGTVWMIFSSKSKTNFLPLFRAMKRVVQDSPFRRVEMAIPYGFKQGCRRAELMGFTLECERARKFTPNGLDSTLYSWVRE